MEEPTDDPNTLADAEGVVISGESPDSPRSKLGGTPNELFDTENPLAWVEADDAVPLGRMT